MLARLAGLRPKPAASAGPKDGAPLRVPPRDPAHRAGLGRAASGAGLGNLQILRGLAASSVLAHHVCVYAQALRGAERPWPALDAALGLWGVCAFFAISGFLMAGLVARTPPLAFLAHRLVRILPTYLAVVALFAVAFVGLGLPFGGLSPLALSLAPAGPRTYPLNVEWTLVFEVAFYVGLFGVALAGLARRIVPLALGWLVLLALASAWLPGAGEATLPPLHGLFLAAACVPFAGGLLLPALIAQGWMRPAAGWLALPLAAACPFVDLGAARWLAGLAACCVVGAAASGRQVAGETAPARAALALGDWSYVLYLVHVPAIALTAWALPAQASGLAFGAAAVAAALALTALLGPLDVALYRRLRGRVDRASPASLRRGLAFYGCVWLVCAVWGSTETVRHEAREARARAALAALPAEAWVSAERATAAIGGRAGSAAIRGAFEGIAPVSPTEAVASGWAADPARPERTLLLALYCDGRLVGLDRPRRTRKDLAGRPGLEGVRGRIGYRMRLPREACAPGSAPVPVVVDGEGGMAVLPPP